MQPCNERSSSLSLAYQTVVIASQTRHTWAENATVKRCLETHDWHERDTSLYKWLSFRSKFGSHGYMIACAFCLVLRLHDCITFSFRTRPIDNSSHNQWQLTVWWCLLELFTFGIHYYNLQQCNAYNIHLWWHNATAAIKRSRPVLVIGAVTVVYRSISVSFRACGSYRS